MSFRTTGTRIKGDYVVLEPSGKQFPLLSFFDGDRMAFEIEEVECANKACGKGHIRKDGVARLHQDGSCVVSYCCLECFYKATGQFNVRPV